MHDKNHRNYGKMGMEAESSCFNSDTLKNQGKESYKNRNIFNGYEVNKTTIHMPLYFIVTGLRRVADCELL
jgi:hypothetical protein